MTDEQQHAIDAEEMAYLVERARRPTRLAVISTLPGDREWIKRLFTVVDDGRRRELVEGSWEGLSGDPIPPRE